MKAAGGADGQAALANSILAAVRDCAPLPFTAALGAAIAGQILAIRFVGRPHTTSAEAQTAIRIQENT